jgi:hypothetical protein
MTPIGSFSLSKNPLAVVEISIILLALCVPLSAAWAESAAKVTHLRGTLSVRHADGSQGLLALQSEVKEKDTLSTEADTYARLKFIDNAETVLRPGSELSVDRYRYVAEKPETGNVLLRLLKGGLRRVTGLIGKTAPKNEVLTTPVATLGIRGTHYGLLFCRADCGQIATVTGEPLRDGLHVDVVQGKISIKNRAGEVVVGPGQFAYVRDGDSRPRLVPANEGVQVTIPPAILLNSGNGATLDVNNCNSLCSVE